MIEFTGERVIPGEVDLDLWNEHFARYAFAARLARRRRVLDAGCGTGYGAAELARSAASVVGIDISPEAVRFAATHYSRPNLAFVQASCAQLPFPDACFDLAVAFEIIEHLPDWRSFLQELKRTLAPFGQCILSTPNRDYYAESRASAGPNPFHHHEFTYEEFRDQLRAVFPEVTVYVQNHVGGFAFLPEHGPAGVESRLESLDAPPDQAHFFLAVCASSRQTGAPAFFYIPSASNVLREREQHIASLEAQLAERTSERDRLIEVAQTQKTQFESQAAGYEEQISLLQQEIAAQAVGYENQIESLQAELTKTSTGYEQQIASLQAELAQTAAGYEEQIRKLQQEMAQHAANYERKLAELESDLREKTGWAQRTSQELEQKCQELAYCVEVLHETERTLAERTQWAQELDARVQHLEGLLNLVRSSRWIKLGNTLGLGPRLTDQ